MSFLRQARGEVDDLVETMGSRAQRLLVDFLSCLGGVVVLTALSLAFGPSAHAAENSEGAGGLIDGLASTVSAAAETVTGLAEEVVAPAASGAAGAVADTVSQVAEPVLPAVAELPLVGHAAAGAGGAAEAAVEVADEALAATAGLLADEPVSRTTRPLLGALEKLPAVGGAVDALRPAAVSSIEGIDAVLGSIGGAVVSVTAPLGPVRLPSEPGDPQNGDDPEALAPILRAVAASAPHSGRSAALPRSATALSGSPGAGIAPALDSSGPPHAPPGSPAGPGSSAPPSSAASGGGSGGPAACASDDAPSSLPAGERTIGAGSDALPPSPVRDTDVYPD